MRNAAGEIGLVGPFRIATFKDAGEFLGRYQ
jgi:hypothetical protein